MKLKKKDILWIFLDLRCEIEWSSIHLL